MAECYQVVHVEDSEDDAELVRHCLERAKLAVEIRRVETEAQFSKVLEEGLPDIVLCDQNLPSFSATRALALLQERRLSVPVIILSHHVAEADRVATTGKGAFDCLAKDELERLSAVITAAIEEHRRAVGR